uniref:Uncharacterized protein n=1 Tax=Anopheles melas TaxID=34690 RepID=A0A182TUC3_9DIPT
MVDIRSPSGMYVRPDSSLCSRLYPAPYRRSFISLVGALRKCSGTPGIGPFHPSIDARHRLYASYTSRLFGARARYTAHCAMMQSASGSPTDWTALSVAVATCSAFASASPISSLAIRTMRRQM